MQVQSNLDREVIPIPPLWLPVPPLDDYSYPLPPYRARRAFGNSTHYLSKHLSWARLFHLLQHLVHLYSLHVCLVAGLDVWKVAAP